MLHFVVYTPPPKVGWEAKRGRLTRLYVFRNAFYFAILWSMRTSPALARDARAEGPFVQSVRSGACGFVAGVIATCFNAPFDVLKSRVQAEPVACRPPSVLGLLATVVRNEGLAGAYAGFTPKAMRMGLGGAIGICAYDLTHALLRTSQPSVS